MVWPLLLMAGATGLQAGGALFGAKSQIKAAQRQANVALWQSAQQRKAAWDEARDTGAALARKAETAGKTYDLQEQVSLFNADMAGRRGLVEENRARDAADRVLSAQTASWTGSGFDASTGSPVALLAASAAQADMDVQIVRAQTATEQAGYAFQRQGIAQTRMDEYDAASIGLESAFVAAGRRASAAGSAGIINAMTAQKQGMYSATSTLLEGAGKMLSFWTQGK